jgi:molecular chaperone GrpE
VTDPRWNDARTTAPQSAERQGHPAQQGGDPEETAGPVIRDKRRIDPVTGEVREPLTAAAPRTGQPDGPGGEAAAGADSAGSAADLEKALAERTADLQRVQAEFLNYKRRVDRDREAARETAIAQTLTALLPVLDDIGRARDHDELVGGFKAVAESLERIVAGLGLESFGAEGDEFDPRVHEALMHSYSDEVDGPVAKAVLQVGYRHGDRVLRPARVAVVEPETSPDDVLDADDGASQHNGALGDTSIDDGVSEQ